MNYPIPPREDEEPKTIGELVEQLGLEPAPRGEHKGKYECPVCGHQQLSINSNGKHYDCYHCHERGKILGELYRQWRSKEGPRLPVTRQFTPKKAKEEKIPLSAQDWDSGLRTLFQKAKETGWYGDIDKETGKVIRFNSSCNREAIAELEKRGLTREAIEAAGIFTLSAGRMEVTGQVHKDFPGTYWYEGIQWLQGMWIDGASRDSIIIPRFRFWGAERIGCQLRALGPVEKNDRYRPLYSKQSASGNQLLYDENSEPEAGLTFCSPEIFGRMPNTPHQIYLSEAILKPLIACFRHNEIFVGAASGLFLSSKKQFWDILVYCQAIGVTEIIICPDHNTFPTTEKPDGNPGFVTLWTKVYLWIKKEFPEFDVLVAPAEGADIDEVDALPELIPFQAWLAGAVTSSKKIKKMVNGLRRLDKGNRSGLAEVWGTVRSLTKKVQEVARNVRQYFAKKSSAIVLWSDMKRWESIAYPQCPLKPDSLTYDPDNLDSIDWRGSGAMPPIYYEPGRMISLTANLHHEFGKGHFLNTGKPGEGKSHEMFSADPDAFGLEMEDVQIERKNGEIEQCGHDTKIFGYTPSPKNPTSLSLEENYEILKSRAECLYAGDKTTPSGRSYIYSSDGNGKFAAIPNSGNCGRAKSHKALMAFGYSHQQTTGLLCPTCPFYEKCKFGTGIAKVRDEKSGPNDTDFPYGFIYERWNTIKEERQISLHLNQSPTRRIEDGLVGISPISDVTVFDDVQFDTTKDYYITIKSLKDVYWKMGLHEEQVKEKGDEKELAIAGQLATILWQVLNDLNSLLDDGYDRKQFPHGLDDPQFWTTYCQGNIEKNSAVEAYEQLKRLYDKEVTLSTEIPWRERASDEEIWRNLNRIFTNGSTLREELAEAYRPETVLRIVEKHALPQWLIAFLMAAIGKGAIRCLSNTIIVTLKDFSQVYRSRAAINIHLNATTTREQLARQIRVPAKDIVEIRPLPLPHDNLTVRGIRGFGKLTAMSRSQDETKRLRAIITEKIARWGKDNVSLIDHKKHVESGMYDDLLPRKQQGWWFCHNRATNAFEQYPCRIAIGDPRTNWGRLAVEWQVTTGEQIDLNARDKHPAFWKHERELMQAERIQDVGRLRSGRKDEPCLYIKIGGDMNLGYLQEHYQNCSIEYVTADGEAAPKEKTNWIRLSDICQAFAAIQDRGEEPKLAAISDMTGLSTTMISRNVKEYGGFKAFPKTCKALLKELTEECKNLQSLSKEQEYLASAAFPEALRRYEAKRSAALARMEAGERWTERIVKDTARALTDYTMELITPVLKMPAVPMREFVHSLSSESRQGLWQAILTLFPSNPVLDELESILDFSPG